MSDEYDIKCDFDDVEYVGYARPKISAHSMAKRHEDTAKYVDYVQCVSYAGS